MIRLERSGKLQGTAASGRDEVDKPTDHLRPGTVFGGLGRLVRRTPAGVYGLEALGSLAQILVPPSRSDRIETGGGRSVAAIAAAAPAKRRLRNSNGKVIDGDGSTLFKAGKRQAALSHAE